jgi:phytoene dehydrogenase-like protein
VTLERGVAETAAQLGPDAAAYRRLVTPFVRAVERAATVHLGATLEEISRSERDNRSECPFVLLAQQSCSSATPPGGGVHGLCGVAAARLALHGLR